jgi:quercetin dioxygenase-like cupin family protein
MENEVCMTYVKGDFAVIKMNKIHSVINIGNENRYTLQVSGFADKDTFI